MCTCANKHAYALSLGGVYWRGLLEIYPSGEQKTCAILDNTLSLGVYSPSNTSATGLGVYME